MRSSKNQPIVIEAIESRLLMTTVYVDQHASGSVQNGTSWNTAYLDLQSALQNAGASEIRVADGVYKPTSGTNRVAAFALRENVSIVGGYAGVGAVNPNQRDLTMNLTILSGDIGIAGDPSDNSNHVIEATSLSSTAVLDGVIVTASATSAGIMTNSHATFRNCRFQGNITDGYGGAFFMTPGSTPSFDNCTFVGNTAALGGAIYAVSGAGGTFNNCTFSGNKAGYGTSIFAVDDGFTPSNITISNSIIWDADMRDNKPIEGKATATYSNIAGGMIGEGNANIDPKFVRNPSAGADRVWGTVDDDFGDTRLRAYSPVVDAGSNSLAPLSTDADLTPRFVDVPTASNSPDGWVDMGAFEAVAARSVTAGGTYQVVQGHDYELHAFGASGFTGALSFAWDFDSDGKFDDATGANASFASKSLSVGTTVPVSVRMTDGVGGSVISSTTLTIAPAVLRVDARAVGTNDGSSWVNAFSSLNEAIYRVLPLQDIHVATGTYSASSTGDRFASFSLRSGTAIIGGYAGLDAANPDKRDVTAYTTILSGDIGLEGFVNDNSVHVVDGRYTDSTAVLDGVTIKGGFALYVPFMVPYYNISGGGLFILNGSPTISNCVLTMNAATYGSGVSIYNGSPSFTDCAFTANGFDRGGGVYERESASTYLRCKFLENTGGGNGGGIYSYLSAPTIDTCSFVRNLDTAVVFDACSSVTVRNTEFLGNSGGAISSNSNATFDNCLFSGNAAAKGGAVRIASGNHSFTNCTFTANDAEFGAAVYVVYAQAILMNCIVWANTSANAAQLVGISGGSFVISRSLIQGGYTGSGNISADPSFVRNPSPGPDVKWQTSDDDYGDLRLQAGSPCIDSGDNSLVPAGTVTDLAGNARFVDSPGVNDPGVIVDMGAYERQLPIYATGATLQTDGALPALNVSFNVPLSSTSISASDLVIQAVLGDGSIGGNVPVTAFSYDPVSRSIRFSIPAAVADGNYRATLAAGSVADAEGNAAASSAGFDFFTLAGDANHDRKVDINDLAALAANWHGNSKTFSQGDFDYNGIVDSGDLAILAGNWQKTLAPPAPAAPVSTRLAPPKRTATRVASLVL